jgi:hypothetical protein
MPFLLEEFNEPFYFPYGHQKAPAQFAENIMPQVHAPVSRIISILASSYTPHIVAPSLIFLNPSSNWLDGLS